jgi:hypothetical protein
MVSLTHEVLIFISCHARQRKDNYNVASTELLHNIADIKNATRFLIDILLFNYTAYLTLNTARFKAGVELYVCNWGHSHIYFQEMQTEVSVVCMCACEV